MATVVVESTLLVRIKLNFPFITRSYTMRDLLSSYYTQTPRNKLQAYATCPAAQFFNATAETTNTGLMASKHQQ